MVNSLKIGVIGIQGAISEHLKTMDDALKITKTSGKVFVIKDKKEIKKIDAMILPGGESTTISRALYSSGLYDTILNRIHDDDLPILGTCAGCVILASEVSNDEKVDNSMTKVVLGYNDYVLYESREKIPHNAPKLNISAGLYAMKYSTLCAIYEQTGVYYNRYIINFTESLEQLKWLENGFRIKSLLVKPSINIDTKKDYEQFKNIIGGK